MRTGRSSHIPRLAVPVALVMAVLPAAPAAADHDGTAGSGPHAVHYGDGCATSALPPNDDGSSGAAPLADAFPEGLDFFGSTYTALYVNNNGNVTFDGPLSTFTPFPLLDTDVPMIAPFFGDVDTRGAGSDIVRYGTTTFEGRPAFCVLWAGVGVGYYSGGTDRLNEFQLLLVNRSDVGAGDFDIVFNYDQVQWEAGSASGGSGGLGGSAARAGYSNGVDRALELPGSGLAGAFLDTNTVTGLIHNLSGQGVSGAQQLGRYVFPVRNGEPPSAGSITGVVTTGDPAAAVPGTTVSACGGDDPATSAVEQTCQVSVTNDGGGYVLPGLPPGEYSVAVSPPGDLLPARQDATVSGTAVVVDFHLAAPVRPPTGTTLGEQQTAGGTPVVVVGRPFEVTVPCPDGGTGEVQFVQGTAVLTVTHGGSPTQTVALTPDGAGNLVATGIALGTTGPAQVVLTLTGCGAAAGTSSFDIYIDPSGRILDQHGSPVQGATVTLLRSDSATGPFSTVPDGSTIMSPANRSNPMLSAADGYYGWLTVPGFYLVRATPPADCTVPGGGAYVESDVLPVPPEQTGIDLILECTDPNTPPVLQVPGTTSADATGPQGATVTFDVTVVDGQEDDLVATCAPASGTSFAIGTTTVECSVTDGGGMSDTATFDVHVRGAAEQMLRLRATIVSWELRPRGQQVALVSKLDAAGRALSAGRDACGPLRALVRHATAQRGKHLTVGRAEEAVARATQIQDVLAC
jgi:hypothetical protein